MKVTIKQLVVGQAALKKLSDNAKLDTPLFLKLARLWKRVSDEIDLFSKTSQAKRDTHRKYVDLDDGKGNMVPQSVFKSLADEIADRNDTETLLDDAVELNVDPVAWEVIEQAIKEKKIEGFTAVDVAALDWLIELPAA
jgi:hypothetical protein